MKMLAMVNILSLLGILMCSLDARAAVKTKTVDYKQGDTALEGYVAYDDSLSGKLPGVIIVHEWNGIGPYVKKRAEQIASLGYVAFCIDIYGKGVRPKDMKEAGEQATLYRNNRQLMRERARAGLEEMKKMERVDTSRIAAMGYCFGGGVVLELARSGADIRGAVSFHGNLDTPHPEETKALKAKILVLHGADDPHVTPEQVSAFQSEMRKAGADWQMNIYGNAVHAFSNPDAGNDPSKGAAYNKEADHRSWEAMKLFYREIFGKREK
jgi:dienelactone hydrolase